MEKMPPFQVIGWEPTHAARYDLALDPYLWVVIDIENADVQAALECLPNRAHQVMLYRFGLGPAGLSRAELAKRLRIPIEYVIAEERAAVEALRFFFGRD